VTKPVQVQDFPIRRRTIGNIESPAIINVRARIDSQVLEQHVRDGQMVRKGDLLFTLDDREIRAAIAQSEAQLAKDQATLARTELDVRRAEELLRRNAAPRTQLEQATAENKGAIATVQSDQAQIEADRVRLSYTKIVAPMDGRIGAVRVTPGNLVSAGDAAGLVTLTQMQPLRVGFTLPERDLPALQKAIQRNPPAPVRVFQPGASEPLATGQLDFVDTSVDPSSGTIIARATFANQDLTLWPGKFVDVEVDLDVRPNTALVPGVAIQSGQKGSFVFVVNENGTAEMRNVRYVGTLGDQIAVAAGVNAGERVVVEGQMRLSDGARVTEATQTGTAAPQASDVRSEPASQQAGDANPAAQPAGASR
jgi:multidrug efflux system membrane fusion protein